jgi:hypothetical protein
VGHHVKAVADSHRDIDALLDEQEGSAAPDREVDVAQRS